MNILKYTFVIVFALSVFLTPGTEQPVYGDEAEEYCKTALFAAEACQRYMMRVRLKEQVFLENEFNIMVRNHPAAYKLPKRKIYEIAGRICCFEGAKDGLETRLKMSHSRPEFMDYKQYAYSQCYSQLSSYEKTHGSLNGLERIKPQNLDNKIRPLLRLYGLRK